ncbi:hypothetical protein RB195_012089 [Necator americanus]|uniref:Uncharacterized protein n=1 Tax=Necator americanus TaxID=51031 RepID=A0ABR1D5G3_NECAM
MASRKNTPPQSTRKMFATPTPSTRRTPIARSTAPSTARTPSSSKARTPMERSIIASTPTPRTPGKDVLDVAEADAMEKERLNVLKQIHRRLKWSRRFGVCCRFMLIFTLVLLFCVFILSSTLLLFISVESGKDQRIWKLHPRPLSYEFQEFAVSSNSETCNELGRSLFIEGHSIFGVAAGIARCLATTEPYKNDINGYNVAIFLNFSYERNSTNCQQSVKRTKTYEISGENTTVTEDFSLEGAYRALLEKMNRSEIDVLDLKLSRGLRTYPMSKSFAEYLSIIGSEQVLQEECSNTFDEDFKSATYVEGDIIQALPWPNFSSLRNVTSTMSTSSSEEINTQENFTTYSIEEDIIWMDIPVIKLATNQSVCRPNISGNTPNVIDLFTGKEGSSLLKSSNIGRVTGSEMSTTTFYFQAYSRIWSFLKDHSFKTTKKKMDGIRKKKNPPYSGNFFTVLDKRNQLAIAYSGIPGLSSVSSTSSQQIRIDMDQVTLQPLILFDNEIKLVLAGPGGDMTQSLEIPRIIHTLLYYFAHGTSFIRAITTPTLFPHSYNLIYYNDGVPQSIVNAFGRFEQNVGRYVRKLKKIGPLSMKDTLSGIEVRNASAIPILFNLDGTSIVTNGL